jgi:hypothetical protein
MGMVFGRQTVAEPAFEILLQHDHHILKNGGVETAYELRKYGERFAAEIDYVSDDSMENMDYPFRALAQYIGVFGKPQNEGSQAIDMTAPVVVQGGTRIAMTAPVVTEKASSYGTNDNESGSSTTMTMKFFLPSEYDDISKIPKPTNPDVRIEEMPAQYGAVHRFSGLMSESKNQKIAKELAHQLIHDGVTDLSEDYVLQHYQFWGYNPPFTIPMFRRNEVWVELTEEQVMQLVQKFSPPTAEN